MKTLLILLAAIFLVASVHGDDGALKPVALRADVLARNEGDLWDSGKVPGEDGKPLADTPGVKLLRTEPGRLVARGRVGCLPLSIETLTTLQP